MYNEIKGESQENKLNIIPRRSSLMMSAIRGTFLCKNSVFKKFLSACCIQ